MEGQYNLKSPAVKRLMREAQELREPTEDFFTQPIEENLFEWHFTVRGPRETEFESGVYHGRIILPPEYPMKPPSIILLTPNGRFELHKKVCLSISGHHPESWQPSWSIRTALLAIIGFMPTPGQGAIGSLDYSVEERKKLAKKSLEWSCPMCGEIKDVLRPRTPHVKPATSETGARSRSAVITGPTATEREISEIVSQMTLKAEEDPAPPPPKQTASNQDEGGVEGGPVDAASSATVTRVAETRAESRSGADVVNGDSGSRERVSVVSAESAGNVLRERLAAAAASSSRSANVEARPQAVNQANRLVASGVDSQCVRTLVYYASLALLSVAIMLLLFVRAAKHFIISSP